MHFCDDLNDLPETSESEFVGAQPISHSFPTTFTSPSSLTKPSIPTFLPNDLRYARAGHDETRILLKAKPRIGAQTRGGRNLYPRRGKHDFTISATVGVEGVLRGEDGLGLIPRSWGLVFMSSIQSGVLGARLADLLPAIYLILFP